MIIESSQLQLSSTRQFSRIQKMSESRVEGFVAAGERWNERQLESAQFSKRQSIRLYNTFGQLEASQQKQALSVTGRDIMPVPTQIISTSLSRSPEPDSNTSKNTESDPPSISARLQLMMSLIEAMTGKKIRLIEQKQIQTTVSDSSNISPSRMQQEATAQTSDREYGLLYQYSESTTETETTDFQALGRLTTAAGETLNIDLYLKMSRISKEQFQFEIREGAAILKDPLAINFTANPTQLSNEKFLFDIDADGIKDNISFVSSSSGFLALDKNRDGEINNGSELFGAISGNGFADLSQYDDDKNGFIDAGDNIFTQLSIWASNRRGNKQLYTLAEKNVAAIYLGSAASAFDLKNSNNELSGKIQRTGIYITEDKQAATVQQVDLVV